ncbi:metallophosphoesterase [Patescibacteria group bacterium]|nr:metallophosphoesterase [Patescibacteria group bacterium]
MKLKKLLLAAIVILIAAVLFWFLYQPSLETFVIYGDSRTGHAAHQKIVNAIAGIKPTVVFHAGDLVEDGADPDQWAIFNAITSELTKTAEFYPALGNHEGNSQLFFDKFDLPNNEQWYSVEKNDIHFIVLDSNSDNSKDSEQYKWLESDLRNISDKIKFTIVIFHHPPLSTGPHPEDEKGLRQTIVPLFEQYGVDIVFNGHTHAYEKLLYNDIYYIITGGGGAPLYDQARTSPYSQLFIKVHHFCRLSITDNQLVVDVFDADLNLIDQFKINSK